MHKTVGILGGMGPEATADLFAKIVRSTPASRDQDHVRVVIDSNPQIPDRVAALAGRGPDPRPALVATARNLLTAGAELIAMPCNTAHAYYDDLQVAVQVPILHMMREVAAELRGRRFGAEASGRRVGAAGSGRRVGLLATDGTLRTGLYQRELARVGVEALVPDEEHQGLVMDAIYGPCGVKAGHRDRAAAPALAAGGHLRGRGAQALVLGCTELPLVPGWDQLGIEILDATTILARAVVREAARDDRRAQV